MTLEPARRSIIDLLIGRSGSPPRRSPSAHEFPAVDAADLAHLLPRSALARLTDEPARFVRKGFARFAEFLPARINLSWITDDLAIGGAFPTRHVARLRRLGITAVVDCREEASDDEQALAHHGISFLRLPTPDAHDLSQDHLDLGVSWASERLQDGEKVYVHCWHGVGRGPLLGCCILVASGYSAADALGLVKARRWQASPNEEQLGALLEYARRRNGEG